MKLRLLLLGPDRLLGSKPEITLEDGAIVIGRSREVDWCLDDPERIVSKKHCMIEANGGAFLLTDMSTNGVTINGLPVDRTRPGRLASGDVLALGDAVVRVQIERGVDQPKGADREDNHSGKMLPDLLNPFGEGPFGFDNSSSASSDGKMPDILQEPMQKTDEILQPDWWSASPETPENKSFDSKTVEILDADASSIKTAVPQGVKQLSALERDVSLIFSAWHSRGLDAFMAAVRDAYAVLPDGHREEFEKRLEALLTTAAGN